MKIINFFTWYLLFIAGLFAYICFLDPDIISPNKKAKLLYLIGVFALIVFIPLFVYMLQRFEEKLPPTIRAIKDAFFGYFKYLLVAIYGGSAIMSIKESKGSTDSIITVSAIVLITCTWYVLSTYKKHLKKYNKENPPSEEGK